MTRQRLRQSPAPRPGKEIWLPPSIGPGSGLFARRLERLERLVRSVWRLPATSHRRPAGRSAGLPEAGTRRAVHSLR